MFNGIKTPFHEEHVKAGGRLMSISEWIRPLHYGSPDIEVRSVRTTLGIFDLHPMSRHIVKGPDALEFMQFLVTSDVQLGIRNSVAQYTCFCDEQGGIIDDVLIFPRSVEEFLITSSVGAAKVLNAWIKRWVEESGLQVQLHDVTEVETQFALQGPLSLELIRKIMGGSEVNLQYMQFTRISVLGMPVFLSRTGYTGEIGFEFIVDIQNAVTLWRYILESGKEFGIEPFGIIAAQMLRLEKGYLLNGIDMNSQNNPYEVDLGWTVSIGKENFLGKEALLRLKTQGVCSRLRKFYIEGTQTIPSDTEIYSQGRIIGRVTSCSNSITLGRVIGMGLVNTSISDDCLCYVRRGDLHRKISFVEKAFYDPEGSRLRLMLPKDESNLSANRM